MATRQTKKELRQKIEETLAQTFEGLKNELSQKKFERNIRRASKVLAAGVKTKSSKKKEAKTVEHPASTLATA